MGRKVMDANLLKLQVNLLKALITHSRKLVHILDPSIIFFKRFN
jgi:hypothetical protein